MTVSAQSRACTFTTIGKVNRPPLFSKDALREMAGEADLTPAATELIRRHFPEAGSLARAAPIQCGRCDARLDLEWRCTAADCPHRSAA